MINMFSMVGMIFVYSRMAHGRWLGLKIIACSYEWENSPYPFCCSHAFK